MTDEEAASYFEELIECADVVDASYTDCVKVEAIRTAFKALKERKTGKWIITARNGVLCSECKSGTRKMPMLFGNPLYKYCPFCGIKMEGKDADSN